LHDANHLAFPEHFGRATAIYYRWVVRPRLRTARALLTNSEFSRAELVRHLGIAGERWRITPLATEARFHLRAKDEILAVRAKHNLPEAYLLLVGNPKVHKNLGLIVGIARRLPLPVVLLAGTGVRTALDFPENTVELGAVSDDELACLYSAATALLLPSWYEGFGLPALEAMACGCPVLAADAGALPEVMGSAGVLLPKDSGSRWLQAAERICSDPTSREELRRAGLARAAEFSWERCARQTAEAYEQALL
jgi:glycosyltransferase involved in cell wall biosynthesis